MTHGMTGRCLGEATDNWDGLMAHETDARSAITYGCSPRMATVAMVHIHMH